MKFVKLEAHNFRSYKDLSLDFTKNKGLVLVQGNLPQSPNGSSNSAGKAQPTSTRIFTPEGVTTLGELKVGDYVYNRQGRPIKVLDIFEKGNLPVYDVVTVDDRHILVNDDHLFSFWDSKSSNTNMITASLKKMLAGGIMTEDKFHYQIPVAPALNYPEDNTLANPYEYGTTIFKTPYETLKKLQYSSLQQRSTFISGLMQVFNPRVVNPNKAIMPIYNLPIEYTTIIIDILRSLGLVVYTGQTLSTDKVQLTIKGAMTAWQKTHNGIPIDRVAIKEVHKKGYSMPMRCIYVDDYEHLYVSSDYLVSHNTTLYTSLLYALYGKLPNGESGDSIINNKVGKGMKVVLEFECNAHKYRVERYRKDKEYKNKVLLFQDNKDITLPSNKETNNKIVSIVGINETTTLNSIVFGSNNLLSFVNATDKQRKEMLEELTGIKVYQTAQNNVKEDAKILADELFKAHEKVSSLNDKGNAVTALKTTYDASMQSYLTSKASYEVKLESFQNTTDFDEQGTKQSIADLVANINQLKQRKDKLQLQQFNTGKLNQVTQAMSEMKSEFNAIKQRLMEADTKKAKINNEPETTCYVCGSILDADHKAKELAYLNNTIKQDSIKYQAIMQQAPKLKADYDALLADKAKVEEYNNSLLQQQRVLQDSIDTKQNELNQANLALSTYKSHQDSYQWIKQQLANLKEPVKPDIPDTTNLDQAKQELQAKITKLEAKQEQLKKLVDIFGLQGVKSYVLASILPFVNEHVAHYLSILTDNRFNIVLHAKSVAKSGSVSDKLSLEVISQSAGSTYDELSSGEQQRVDLAISLSLQDYLLSKVPDINFLVFDEVFGHLDYQGSTGVMTILKERAQQVPNIFVIAHDPDLKDQFENTIMVEKVDGISKVLAG